MPGLTLRAGEYEATFRPDIAMLCTSLRYAGEEHVAWPRPLTQFKAGHATALPLLHPWANRLGRWSYDAAGQHVSLDGLELPTDTNGLPIHGNLYGTMFATERADETRVVASLDYGAQPDKLRAFPFPHVVTVDAHLDAARGLTIVTHVRPTADVAVPVSFGWHPYLRLSGAPRNTWELHWPACDHVEVDAHTIPTGARTPQPAARAPIGRRTFDDCYALGDHRTLAIATADRTLALTFDTGYPFAQLYVPPRRRFVAIEPMAAEIDALGRGTAPLCPPGERFDATFRISLTDEH